MANNPQTKSVFATLGWLLHGAVFCFFGYLTSDFFAGERFFESLYDLGFSLLFALLLAFFVQFIHSTSWGAKAFSNSAFGIEFFFIALSGYGVGLLLRLLIVWLEGGAFNFGVSVEILLLGLALGVGTLAASWFFKS